MEAGASDHSKDAHCSLGDKRSPDVEPPDFIWTTYSTRTSGIMVTYYLFVFYSCFKPMPTFRMMNRF